MADPSTFGEIQVDSELEFLRNKFKIKGGSAGFTLSNTFVPVINFDQSLFVQEQQTISVIATLNNAGDVVEVAVPQGEEWLVHHVSVSAEAASVVRTCGFFIEMGAAGIGRMGIGNTASNNLAFRLMYSFPNPLLMVGGQTITYRRFTVPVSSEIAVVSATFVKR